MNETEYPDFDPSAERDPPGARTLVKAFLVTVGVIGSVVAVAAVGTLIGREQAERTEPVAVAVQEPLPAPPAEPGADLLAAQAQVQTLEQELATRSAELEAVAKAAGVPPDQLANTDLTQEVANIKANLDAARKYRDRIKKELAQALDQVDQAIARAETAEAGLVAQTAETERVRTSEGKWRSASGRNLWAAFASQAQLDICERGTKRALERCQEDVSAWFTDARYQRFSSCASRGHVPVLLVTDRDEAAPSNAEAIEGDDLPRRKTWHVLYCDPALPEAESVSSVAPVEPPVASVARVDAR